jgi:YD repeat-containing protein
LSITPQTNTATSPVPINFNYTIAQLTTAAATEFFFEGFEQNSSATSGSAHTGNMYWNGNYTTSYTPPNSRTYLIQWWNLANSVWKFNEQTYTSGMVLTGPVDDIRIFPIDALLTTFTYSPLIGKTSETSPSGKSIIYQYDGLNRLQTIRDQDNNILKQYDYEYQLLAAPVYNIAESGTFVKQCSTGYFGSSVTYTVPAGTYSSYISQTDANQKAINDVNANGQAYANANGTCIPAETIVGTNSTSATYNVTFTNNSTSVVYGFILNSNTYSSTTLGQVPAGTYTVRFYPRGQSTTCTFSVNGSTYYGTGATFSNVSVNSQATVSMY